MCCLKKSRSFKYSILLVLFSTVAIEIIQLVMNYFYLGNRIFDIGDVILNTTGGLLGFALLSAITPILRKTEI
ncbi:VanZ family protein [Amylolactobacillus amylophilus]|uniref:VanZ family protein n=1 Tax=Amylolactobacillus amylophilus TaxID=1603 RepID=UPI0034E2BB2C